MFLLADLQSEVDGFVYLWHDVFHLFNMIWLPQRLGSLRRRLIMAPRDNVFTPPKHQR